MEGSHALTQDSHRVRQTAVAWIVVLLAFAGRPCRWNLLTKRDQFRVRHSPNRPIQFDIHTIAIAAAKTSFVDGLFQSAGFEEDTVVECHGSIHWLQCAGSCEGVWPVGDTEIEVEEAPEERYRSLEEITAEVKALEKQMREAAKALEFEKAAEIRDRVKALRAREFGLK